MFNRKVYTQVLLAAALSYSGGGAQAAVDEISAVFKPDPANPMSNKFVNTTPESGLCAWHPPATVQCKARNIFSLRNTAIRFRNSGSIIGGHATPQEGTMFKVPSEFRDVQVTHTATGKVETLQVRIAAIGTRMDFPRPPGQDAWVGGGNMFRDAPSPCIGVNYLAAGITMMLWFWIVPENAGLCYRQVGQTLVSLVYQHMEYAYELKTPNPLGMETGEYRGNITYSIGPGADFDMGNFMIPSDNSLTLSFTLDVQHQLKVEVPPGGNRVELLPQGGWQSWLNNNRQPARLFRDQTFNISASSRFKMKLECGQEMGDTCGLRNAANHQVPMQISVSLPNGLTRADGTPVNRQPLLLSGAGTELFQPGFYVDRKPGILHFEVGREDTKEMLKHGGSQYSGTATVVWDSEV
ncbi:hypothetical protein ATI02_0183 [Pseudomonas baetica]|uniref:Uncharacterized protein n=1 Tax=Pseudomonas baetica TaxID=674054 RepID=A0ABX4PR21_9PSED|nr:hypothetical protein [Pseudomonas baetica]PKA67484.1 hypothetical protein ATI02_0183 [Pseudomonas baetica]